MRRCGTACWREAVADAKYAELRPRPAQVRAFYDRHRADLYTTDASYRLGKITVPGEKLAEKLVRLLRRGAGFAEVARRYSMDPGPASGRRARLGLGVHRPR